MSEGITLASQLFSQCAGKKVTHVEMEQEKFLAIDFGEKDPKTQKAWQIWVYAGAWRIDQAGEPYIGANDELDIIIERLKLLEKKKLLSVTIENEAFDASLFFEQEIKLSLFTDKAYEDEQWVLFAPDEMIFVSGPGNQWAYKSDLDD